MMSIVSQPPGVTGSIKHATGEPSVVTHFRVAIQVFSRNHRTIALQDEADAKLQGTCTSLCGDDALALEQPTDTPKECWKFRRPTSLLRNSALFYLGISFIHIAEHLAYVCTTVFV